MNRFDALLRIDELRMDIAERDAEIARLRAPPGADAMELARQARRDSQEAYGKIGRESAIDDVIACALQSYGDERAREGLRMREGFDKKVADMDAKRWRSLTETEKVRNLFRAIYDDEIENAKQEARAAAIEEVAHFVEDHMPVPAAATWGKFIRALAVKSESES